MNVKFDITAKRVSQRGLRIVEEQKGGFGFTDSAENWNGRLAMLGVIIGVLTEYVTGQGVLSQLGLF